MRTNPSKSKYFFIGLSATGNYTAAKAMQILGYQVWHFPPQLGLVNYFDVLTDPPVAMWFRQELLPKDATYVLTVRAIDPWLESCQAWFDSRPLPTLDPISQQLRWFLYGGLTFDRDRFVAAYQIHLETCRQLAAFHQLKLHEWNVVANPDWDFLCRLTQQPCPAQPFPLQLSQPYRRATWQGALTAAAPRTQTSSRHSGFI